jgi:prefoldin subunit 5
MLDVGTRSGMARTTIEKRLEDYDRRHRELAAQIAEIGIVAAGSVTRRFTHCTSVGCRCNADPPTPHGPYWQWTAKVNGKTVTKRLTEREAQLYKEWISNDRRIRSLLEQIRKVDAKATELLLQEAVSG